MDEELPFALETLFEDEKKRRSDETVRSGSRRSDSINPLDRLIRLEEREQMVENGSRLKDYMYKNLDFAQLEFLTKYLGREWYKLRMPLEFRHFTPDEFKAYVADRFEGICERIDILMQHSQGVTDYNKLAALQEFISIPFNLTGEDKIIEIYEQVRTGVRDRYPIGFFHSSNKRVPKILTRLLVDDVLRLPRSQKTIEDLTPATFEENGLLWMLEQYFAGDVKAALRHAYSTNEFPQAYGSDPNSTDVLREVFIQLNGGIKRA